MGPDGNAACALRIEQVSACRHTLEMAAGTIARMAANAADRRLRRSGYCFRGIRANTDRSASFFGFSMRLRSSACRAPGTSPSL